ncbi:MAG TPA: ABC-type transport auxiliary lipoprotein family protein [Casimicrobiaceae bacterium]|nr:ABC-type transport auxiliary lipoprotein family protein [Casimicrobiaceae bacterium]
MRHTFALLFVVLLTACAAPGMRQADRFYVLEAGAGRGADVQRDGVVGALPTAVALDGQLQRSAAVAVLPTTVASFYDTQDIVFSRTPGTRGYYQFNHWAERPNRVVQAQLGTRLMHGGEEARYLLATHIDEIYHDAVEAPGTARVFMTAQVIDARTRRVLARRSFASAAPATSFDAAGAVHGFDEAVAHVLDDVVQWVDMQTRATQPTKAASM